MKVNPIMEECRELITPDIKRAVEVSMFFADWILDMLEAKNMTQRQLAAKLGKSESEISAWLCGTHVFTTKTIAKIEVALGENFIDTTRQEKKVVTHSVTLNFVYSSASQRMKNNWLPISGSTKELYGQNQFKLT